MPGFCPFDVEFFRTDSNLIRKLRDQYSGLQDRSGKLSIIPGATPYLQSAVHECESLESALEKISSLDRKGKYVYRGQTGRHRYIAEGEIPALSHLVRQAGPFRIEVESILPSYARKRCSSDTPPLIDWSHWRQMSRLDFGAAPLRAVWQSSNEALHRLAADACHHTFAQEILGTLHSQLSDVRMQSDIFKVFSGELEEKARSANVPGPLAQLISLAQHYEYPTCMVDVTKSVEVAGWFASHHWTGELRVGEGEGVIYRFDPEKLITELEKMIASYPDRNQLSKLGILGHIDLHAIDPNMCPRVNSQYGGSLFGLESVAVMAVACIFGAVDLFTFAHEFTHGTETGLDIDDMRPKDDPFEKILKLEFQHAAQPLVWEEIEAILAKSDASQFLTKLYQRHWMSEDLDIGFRYSI